VLRLRITVLLVEEVAAAHAVGLLAIGVGAADHPQQQAVARGAGHVRATSGRSARTKKTPLLVPPRM
jgi:hypothetical protein